MTKSPMCRNLSSAQNAASFLIALLLCAFNTSAMTYTSPTCNQSDVQNTINMASNGDTVLVTGGTCSWGAGVTIANTQGITLNGQGTTTITSVGALDVEATTSTGTRVTGFTFTGIGTDNGGDIYINSNTGPVRIDDNTFTNSGLSVFLSIVTATSSGPYVGTVLIDHNNFNGGPASEMIHNLAYGASNAAGWTNNVTPGGSAQVYVETNTFNNLGTSAICSAIESAYGARTVFRYNTLNYCQVDQHGTAGMIGARWWEFYDNTFFPMGLNQCCYADLRAGSGVFYDNHVSGTNMVMGSIDLREEDTGTWPLAYQVGSGINGGTDGHNSCAGGTLNSAPAYVWGNDAAMSIYSMTPTIVMLGRDYFTPASQPATINWQEQSGDTCSTTYVYAPFTYPYPLTANGLPNPSGGGGAPTVIGASPSSGTTAGGTPVTITGTNFVSGATVQFGSNSATSVVVVSSTSITCVTPAGSAGAVNVAVTVGANTGTLTNGFTYVVTPTVTAVSPTSGTVGGGTPITITGTNFVSGATVTLGGTAATSVVVVSATSITAVTPAHGVGAVTVTVSVGGVSGSLNNGFMYLAPTVTSVSPNTGTTAGGTPVTITGTNFVSGATVTFGGTAATSIVVASSTSITAVTPAHSAGAVTVTATVNGVGGNLASGFTYITPPTVTTVSPNSGAAAGGTPVTITGTNFVSGATVTFGGTAATSVVVVSGTSITAVTPAHATGLVTVTVTVSGVSGSLNNGYTYLGPTVTSVSPNTGTTAGGTPVTITGTNFVSGATVTFGSGSATSVVVVSATSITCVTPSGSAGAVTVTVTESGVGGSLANGFTYVATPTVTMVSPGTGTTAGGTPVTITGTNFVSAATVAFASGSATSVVVASSTSITAVTPSGTAGAVTVTVTVSGISGDLPNGFAYVATPTVTGVSPNTGTTAGSTPVTITGTNFVSGATVKFGANSATSVVVVSSTSITCDTPAGSAGAVNVSVTVSGLTGTLTNGYTYVATPTVTGVSPGTGTTAGGTPVTITGTNFVSGATVTFASGSATSVVVVSGTSITAVTPSGSAGAVTVTVTVSGISGDLASAFTYVATPTVTMVSPGTGTTAGGTPVTITGTNFVSGATVHFASGSATSVVVVSGTSITAVTPSGGAGPVSVTVTVSGISGSLASGFTYVATPTVSAVSPTTGSTAGGTPVTITGTNFVSGATVTFGSNSATSVVVVNSTSITAVTPSGSAGMVNVTVTVSGISGDLSNGFTYVAPPTVTLVAPSSGAAAGGTPVTLTGTNFVNGATVTFGPNSATSVVVVTSMSITCVAPAGTGTVNVKVTVNGVSGTDPNSYTYTGGSVAPPTNFSVIVVN
jgi:IPT/TIG domain